MHAPYKGGPPLAQDLLGGHLAASIATIGLLHSHVQTGTLRALATTAPSRSATLPNVPTFKELGYPKLESVEHFGILVPAPTPADVVTALNRVVIEALRTDALKGGLAKLSLKAAEASPTQFEQLIRADTQRWAGIVKASGFTPLD